MISGRFVSPRTLFNMHCVWVGRRFQVFPKEVHRTALGDAGQLAEYSISESFIEWTRLKACSLKICQQVSLACRIVLNCAQERRAVSLSAVPLAHPHRGNVDRRTP